VLDVLKSNGGRSTVRIFGRVVEKERKKRCLLDLQFRAVFNIYMRTDLTKNFWRCRQSRANSSPPKIPANREKYREYSIFGAEIVVPAPHKSAHMTELIGVATSGRTGNFAEIPGNLDSLMCARTGPRFVFIV